MISAQSAMRCGAVEAAVQRGLTPSRSNPQSPESPAASRRRIHAPTKRAPATHAAHTSTSSAGRAVPDLDSRSVRCKQSAAADIQGRIPRAPPPPPQAPPVLLEVSSWDLGVNRARAKSKRGPSAIKMSCSLIIASRAAQTPSRKVPLTLHSRRTCSHTVTNSATPNADTACENGGATYI